MHFARASSTRINDGVGRGARGCVGAGAQCRGAAGVSVLQISAISRDIVARDRVALPQSEYN